MTAMKMKFRGMMKRGVTQVGDEEVEMVEEFPIIFKFYEDRFPHKKH